MNTFGDITNDKGKMNRSAFYFINIALVIILISMAINWWPSFAQDSDAWPQTTQGPTSNR
jgi:hypothetical protein